MRILVMTGSGGAGTSTLAAATAAQAARSGRKTLVLSTGTSHDLSSAYAVAAGPDEAAELDTGLYLHDAPFPGWLPEAWPWLAGVLSAGQAAYGGQTAPDPARASGPLDGLAVGSAGQHPTGPHPAVDLDRLAALLRILDAVESGRFDVVVVDAGPLPAAVALLALPETLAGCLRRWFSADMRLDWALGARGDLPGGAATLVAADRLHARLSEVRRILTEPGAASVRLVLTPDPAGLAAAGRALTALGLHGYAVDGLVAGKVLPAAPAPARSAGGGAWRELAAAQSATLAAAAALAAGRPLWQVPYRPWPPSDPDGLADLADEVYADTDPLAPAPPTRGVTVERRGEGYRLVLPLPGARPGDVRLARLGDDVVVGAADTYRVHRLPSALRRCVAAVEDARLDDEVLTIRFTPDPAEWMRRHEWR